MKKWFKHTSLWMWWSNKKNGVKILTDEEWEKIVSTQRKRTVIFI